MWFLPAYIQLSIILPLFMVIYKKLANVLSTIIFATIFVLFYALNIYQMFSADYETTKVPAFHEEIFGYDEFYSGYFMKPWFHFNSYFLGIAMSIMY